MLYVCSLHQYAVRCDCMDRFVTRGFTLVELLVVMGIIALLAMLLVPTFNDVQEHTRAATCQSNLKEIAKAMSSAKKLPYPAQWRTVLREQGLSGVLSCPSDDYIDTDAEAEDFPELEDVFLVQKQGGNVLFSNMQVILDTGTSPEDNQISRVQVAHGITANPGQMLVKVGGECALLRVTYGGSVSFESMIIAHASHGCGSTHWLCIDDGSADWRARVSQGLDNRQPEDEYHPDPSIFAMRLQSGPKYTKQWPALSISQSHKSSYGMSNAVNAEDPRPGQLLMVEYAKDIAKVVKGGFFTDEFGISNTDERGFLRTRHFGLANFATIGGSVRSMTREQLQFEYDQYDNGMWAP